MLRVEAAASTVAPMVPATVPVHRLTVEDVSLMVGAGVLDEDDRLELVEGVLVEMIPVGAEHDSAVSWLNRHFSRPDAPWEVRIQSTLLTTGGFLLPDVLIVDPLARHAQPTSARLIVEVAQSSQARDAEKAADYAAASVAEYWIVDLPGRLVVVRRDPFGPAYRQVARYGDGQVVTPLLAGAQPVDVTSLLG